MKDMRTGPKPLSMHLSLASLKTMQQGAGRDAINYDDSQLKKFIEGVRKYQLHVYKVEQPERTTIWKVGTATLQKSTQQKTKTNVPVVLLVPSLINGSTILDLMPDNSFLEWLQSYGLNAHLLDWGRVTDDPAQNNANIFIKDRLCTAIEFLAKEYKQTVHVLGYCLGGTLLAAAASNNNIASVTFLATPWDFHAGEARLSSRVKFWAEKAPPLLQEDSIVSADWVHTVLASLHPEIIIEKFIKFADMEEGSDEEKLFIAVEDWLNDGVDLPAGFAKTCIQDFFINNLTGQDKWHDLATISCPSLVIASRKDKLIDYESAIFLHKKIKNSEITIADCGHIGMMAGKKAKEEVWQKFADWIKKQP